MTSSRGSALLWVLLLIGLSIGLAAAALAVSRMTVTASMVTLERADGMFYAEAAAELVVSHVRQNSDLDGRLRQNTTTRLTGVLPGADVRMRYEADLSEFNTNLNSRARSFLVTVWPDGVQRSEARPFVARATLRTDLSVAEWFVLENYEESYASSWQAGDHDLPRFATCSASTPRVTTVGNSAASNTLRWSFESGTAQPDTVRVTWKDFHQGANREVTAAGTAAQLGVTTPVVRTQNDRPERVSYLLEAVFEGRVVDACVVEVVSGRAYFSVSPTRVCRPDDTVVVSWDVNAASGVQVRSRTTFGGSQNLSTAPVGSISVAVRPDLLLYPHIELVMPASLGGTRSVQLAAGGC